MNTKNITLTVDDLLKLVTEKTVNKDGMKINSNSSFLAFMSLLQDKLIKKL